MFFVSTLLSGQMRQQFHDLLEKKASVPCLDINFGLLAVVARGLTGSL